ncbi:MAG: acyl-CoA thioesterase [Vampirovibrio sp.]
MPFQSQIDPHETNSEILKPTKIADESAFRLQVPLFNSMVGIHGSVPVGELLKLIDIAGCIPVKRHLGANLNPVTASIDRLDFIAPVFPWEILSLDARMTRVWKTSMESRVVVTAWNFRTDETRLVATAYVVAVATSEQGQGKADANCIPALLPITPEDQLLQRSADLRKTYRQEELLQTTWHPIVGSEASAIGQFVMTDEDGNGLEQNIFGGVVLSHMFDVALKAATSHVGHDQIRCIRQDRMDFKAPTYITDILRPKAVVTKTWDGALEVQVDCEALSQAGSMPRLVASTYLVFVGREGHTQVPEWVPLNEVQVHRGEDALARQRLRDAEASAFGNAL